MVKKIIPGIYLRKDVEHLKCDEWYFFDGQKLCVLSFIYSFNRWSWHIAQYGELESFIKLYSNVEEFPYELVWEF